MMVNIENKNIISSHLCKYCLKPLTTITQMNRGICDNDECYTKRKEEADLLLNSIMDIDWED